MSKKTKTEKQLPERASSNARLIASLRKHSGVSEELLTDDELLNKTKGTLLRQMVEIELAKEDFAKAAIPIIEKAGDDIKRAVSIIGKMRK